ncbi:unnamed protein product [Parnassius apollo]|uniref:(apollo) hypothetical protein n=1 Tax=Parnassius apollo TaxID=110799 RepID=A0A8S3WII9_PARAO|nr:unnamed protein product [Parnassius apollo]
MELPLSTVTVHCCNESRRCVLGITENIEARRIDIVWDLYSDMSLKKQVRHDREQGIRRQVHDNYKLPNNWSNFLKNSQNKEELFKLLGCYALQGNLGIHIVTNIGPTIKSSVPTNTLLTGLNVTSEEADSRIILHAKDMVMNGATNIIIHTVHSAVLIIAISYYFCMLCIDNILISLEKFVIKLYCGDSGIVSVNEARKFLFTKNKALQNIPPTRDALKMHALRAAYKAGYIWGQAFDSSADIPSPSNWECTEKEGQWQPIWTTQHSIWDVARELVKCGCKNSYRGRCSCRREEMPCTLPCKTCNGNCDNSSVIDREALVENDTELDSEVLEDEG